MLEINKNISVRLKLNDIISTSFEKNLIGFTQTILKELKCKPKIYLWYDEKDDKISTDVINKFTLSYKNFITDNDVIIMNHNNFYCWYDIISDKDDNVLLSNTKYKFRSIYRSNNIEKDIFNSIMDFYTFIKNVTIIRNNKQNEEYYEKAEKNGESIPRQYTTARKHIVTKYEQYKKRT